MSDFGLYVHVPLCVRKCGYCDFCSVGLNQLSGMGFEEKVPSSLAEELGIAADKYLHEKDRIATVFIGGGTPSILPVREAEELLDAIRRTVDSVNHRGKREDRPDNLEFTIECNPGTVDIEKLRLYREYGVNRISFGCQSANDEELRALGRIHTWEEFLRSYEIAREAGFTNINVDLMTAIPGQTAESLRHTLQEVIRLRPEHISAYSLIIEEGTPFYEKYAEQPPIDEETDRALYDLTAGELQAAGFVHYEVSNYAAKRPGMIASLRSDEPMGSLASDPIEVTTYACRHNLNYWRRGSYIGIGPSAASFYETRGEFGTRTKHDSDFRGWLSQVESGSDTEGSEEILTREQAFLETVFLGLRMSDGVSVKELNERYSFDAKRIWKAAINRLTASGFMVIDGDLIRLTDKGFFVSDHIIEELTQYNLPE